jgi:hypothetical protein
MRATKFFVETFSDDASVSDHHTAHEWIGVDSAPAAPRQHTRPLEVGVVLARESVVVHVRS